jgi:hypothetical protein
MRKVLISLLLAGAAATPAIAAGPHDWSDRSSAREEHKSARQERSSAREDRQSAREERQSPREERSDRSPQVQPRANFNANANGNAQARYQAVGSADQRDVQAIRAERQQARQDRSNFAAQNGGAYVAPGPRAVSPGQSLRERQAERREDRVQARELRQSARPTPAVVRTHPPVVSNVPRPGTQPPLRTDSRHHNGDHHWDTNWRHNGRYDWQNYRHHHRSIFHLGLYFDPYGWGYQPFSIGWRLWPSYYGRNYWINDPWYYRLPYAPAGYVWVRYWNDALLVDTWSGTVVDVIPGFFW